MTSATDIITYIGVPLAVLGVLPILYTFAFAILTQRRIRKSLIHHGHKPLSNTRLQDGGFTIRSSPMTSLIEVELPRYTIAPLERSCEEYWSTTSDTLYPDEEEAHRGLLERAESTLSMIEQGRVRGFLRGGSWRAFPWKRLNVGRKLYRIQYEDELREPPAEIDFADLVHFLLDWGAVPDPLGWEKLRSGGLWTPTGTVLLRKPTSEDAELKSRGTTIDWVLRTSVPDDSDGVLSMTIRWSNEADSVASVRGSKSLQPGWGRLVQSRQTGSNLDADKQKTNLFLMIEKLKTEQNHLSNSTSCRFRIENNRVTHLHWESNDVETGVVSKVFHSHEHFTASLWFTCTTSSLLMQKQPGQGLWGFELPLEINSFVQKDSMPCGILVLMGILPENDAPQWTTENEDSVQTGVNISLVRHERFLADRAAERLESSMPPEQARVHRQNRQHETMRQLQQDMRDWHREGKERDERRVIDAIASPRMNNRAVAELCLAWLISQAQVPSDWTVEMLAEAVLYLMALEYTKKAEDNSHAHVRSQSYGSRYTPASQSAPQQRGQSGDIKHSVQVQTTEVKSQPQDDNQHQDLSMSLQQRTRQSVSSLSNNNTITSPSTDPTNHTAAKMVLILDEWLLWSQAGGMKRQQYHLLEDMKLELCYAAVLVATIQAVAAADSSGASAGRTGADMLECLELWRKVRLG